ncbi:transcription repressor OFP8-like [Triticum urartu]|nr:transcription repressor OFP8-like [Triticum urartu]
MSSTRARRSDGRQFGVGGRWRHVAVVDTGCRCRPRRQRLASFLWPSTKPPVTRSSSSSHPSSLFPSSASTASSASARVYKHQQEPYGATAKASPPVATKKVGSNPAKKRREKMAAAAAEEEEEVGVAVEKESSDPRGDFRDSMVRMVVEMGLCDSDGLRSMLRRLLALNAPPHHATILAAFAEVCAQLASESSAPPPPAYQYTSDE